MLHYSFSIIIHTPHVCCYIVVTLLLHCCHIVVHRGAQVGVLTPTLLSHYWLLSHTHAHPYVVTLLLHCCYIVVTLLLPCCYIVVTLLLHCCYIVVDRGAQVGVLTPTLLLHHWLLSHTHAHPYVVTLLLHCCYIVVTLLLHCCYIVVTLLLHCCSQRGSSRGTNTNTVAILLFHYCYTHTLLHTRTWQLNIASFVTPLLHKCYIVVTPRKQRGSRRGTITVTRTHHTRYTLTP
jgi:hypothetical protein